MGNVVKKKQDAERVEVTICGQRMALRTDDDPRRLERLAHYVQRKVDEVSCQGPVAQSKLMVLTALNIADDYFRSLDENREFKQEVANRSRTMLCDLGPRPPQQD